MFGVIAWLGRGIRRRLCAYFSEGERKACQNIYDKISTCNKNINPQKSVLFRTENVKQVWTKNLIKIHPDISYPETITLRLLLVQFCLKKYSVCKNKKPLPEEKNKTSGTALEIAGLMWIQCLWTGHLAQEIQKKGGFTGDVLFCTGKTESTNTIALRVQYETDV